MVYGDEIDRMPKPLRSRWFRHLSQRKATLIIGTHVDLTDVGTGAGFDVISHHLQPLDLPELTRIVEHRLDAFSTPSGNALTFTVAELERVLSESEGNPRRAEVICHKVVAAKVER